MAAWDFTDINTLRPAALGLRVYISAKFLAAMV